MRTERSAGCRSSSAFTSSIHPIPPESQRALQLALVEHDRAPAEWTVTAEESLGLRGREERTRQLAGVPFGACDGVDRFAPPARYLLLRRRPRAPRQISRERAVDRVAEGDVPTTERVDGIDLRWIELELIGESKRLFEQVPCAECTPHAIGDRRTIRAHQWIERVRRETPGDLHTFAIRPHI